MMPVTAANEKRNYWVGDQSEHELRLADGVWKVGIVDVEGSWRPLSDRPALYSNFYDCTNEKELDEDGECHTGPTASFILFPKEGTYPDGVRFRVNPENLFGSSRIEVQLGKAGIVYLDSDAYSKTSLLYQGLPVEIYSELRNPAIQSAKRTIENFTAPFPNRTAEMKTIGTIRVVLLLNQKEKLQKDPMSSPNGWHDEDQLVAVQFSEDGSNVLLHSLHEIGGIFRLKDNNYAHGLTWAFAYDLMEELAESAEAKQERRERERNNVIKHLQNTNGENNGSRTIASYIDQYDPHQDGEGFLMYAWGSAYFWKQINKTLCAKGLPDLYKLVDFIHLNGSEGTTDLGKLINAYSKLCPEGAKVFEQAVDTYFRTKTLNEILEAIQTKSDISPDFFG